MSDVFIHHPCKGYGGATSLQVRYYNFEEEEQKIKYCDSISFEKKKNEEEQRHDT